MHKEESRRKQRHLSAHAKTKGDPLLYFEEALAALEKSLGLADRVYRGYRPDYKRPGEPGWEPPWDPAYNPPPVLDEDVRAVAYADANGRYRIEVDGRCIWRAAYDIDGFLEEFNRR